MMDELRSWYEVPAIAHYFHIFRKSFELVDFEIEDFEETLFLDNAPENVSTFLPDLVISLLRGLYKTKDGLNVTLENYNHYLQDLLNHHYVNLQNKDNPTTETEFKHLSTRLKIEILYDMCNWRLELHDAMELTKDLDADDMRVEPVGSDDDGNIYWYFYGTRLYKESYAVQQEKNNDSKEDTNKKSSRSQRKRRSNQTTKSGRKVKKKRLENSSSQETLDEDGKKELHKTLTSKISDTSDATIEENGSDVKPLRLNLTVNAWSLVCSTLEKWNDICDKYKGAKSKSEKELRKSLLALSETLPDIFHEKELALQRKLLAMAPRRVSDRITSKMRQREEEERRNEQERLLLSQQKAKDAEKRQKQLEEEKEKEREKRYKDRERIQEERALRVKQREEQKLVAVNPELAKVLNTTTIKTEVKVEEEEMDSQEDGEDEDDIYAAMKRIMKVLNEDDDAWPFLEPVTEDDAPDYYDYIKNPMDFRTIGEKIDVKEYNNRHEFEADVMLVFENCETYNGTGSSFHKLAKIVKRVFDKLIKNEFPPETSYDDDDFFEVDSPQSKRKKTPKTPKLPKANQDTKTSEEKPKKIKISSKAAKPLDPNQAKLLQIQATMRQLLICAMRHPNPTEYLTAAARLIPPSFGLTPEVIAKMTPAQMQSLVLDFPRMSVSTAMPVHGVSASQNSPAHIIRTLPRATASTATTSAATVSTATAMNPLHQLANAALMPNLHAPPRPQTPFSSTATIKKESVETASKIMSPGQVVEGSPMRFASGIPQGRLGRGSKLILTEAKKLSAESLVSKQVTVATQPSPTPVVKNWEELKNQLIEQMRKDPTIANNISNSQSSATIPTTSNLTAGLPVSTNRLTTNQLYLLTGKTASKGVPTQSSNMTSKISMTNVHPQMLIRPTGLRTLISSGIVTLSSVRPVTTVSMLNANISNGVNSVKVNTVQTTQSVAPVNLLELQKAALQTAAINQISSKLNNRLTEKPTVKSKIQLSNERVAIQHLKPEQISQLMRLRQPLQNSSATSLQLRPSSSAVGTVHVATSSAHAQKIEQPAVRFVQLPNATQPRLLAQVGNHGNVRYVLPSTSPLIAKPGFQILNNTLVPSSTVNKSMSVVSAQMPLLTAIPRPHIVTGSSSQTSLLNASTPNKVVFPGSTIKILQTNAVQNASIVATTPSVVAPLSTGGLRNVVKISTTAPQKVVFSSPTILQRTNIVLPLSLNNSSTTSVVKTTQQIIASKPSLSVVKPHTFVQKPIIAGSVLPSSSTGGVSLGQSLANNKSPPALTGMKQNAIVITPTQLQKLREEGRIVMTQSGHWAMVTSKHNKNLNTTVS